ncbi:MAG TPA: hypothetical protein VH092_39015 [Urbifossiella sp.]|jgi:hypothetical protein|nr:hypothetical protein [Urbifossiella sp.]
MESDLFTLTTLLLDPCLTVEEASREAAATPRRRPTEGREAWDGGLRNEPPGTAA